MTPKTKNNIACAAALIFVLLFVKTSCVATQIRDEGIIAEAPTEDYVGSQKCAGCHQAKYEDWSGKHMSHFVRYKRDISEPFNVNWKNSPINEDEVFIIIGVQKKVAFADKNWKVFSYQYHFKKQKWLQRDRGTNPDFRIRCGPCHTVGLNPSTKRFVEINVGCESCHGPGRMHADAPEAKKMKVPGKTDGVDVLITCGRCHNERRSHARAIKNFNGIFHGKGE